MGTARCWSGVYLSIGLSDYHVAVSGKVLKHVSARVGSDSVVLRTVGALRAATWQLYAEGVLGEASLD